MNFQMTSLPRRDLMHRKIWASLPLAFLACGDNITATGSAEPDTTAPVSSIAPAGPRVRELPTDALIVANEPATIYYTTDGTTPTTSSNSAEMFASVSGIQAGVPVQFFAVDLAGNTEDVQSVTFALDQIGPSAPLNFAATVGNDSVNLRWQNPSESDFAGVLIGRAQDDAADSRPENGRTYSAGDTLPGGDTVIFVGEGTSFGDSALTGLRGYSIYAFDDLGNYSPIAYTTASTSLAPVMASVSVSLSGTVTITSQPTGFTLSGTASYDSDDEELDIDFTTDNATGRPLFSLRAQITNLNHGDANVSDFRDTPAFSLAPAIGSGETRDSFVELRNVDGSQDPVTFDLLITHGPALVSGSGLQDAGGGEASRRRRRRGFNGRRGTVLAPNLRHAFTTQRSSGGLNVEDILSGERVAELAAPLLGLATASNPAISGHTVYYARTRGGHDHGTNNDNNGDPVAAEELEIEFFGFDVDTLGEIGRVSIPSTDRGLARRVAITSTGHMAAVLVPQYDTGTNQAWFVDLTAMELIDTDPETEGVQPVALSSDVGIPDAATFAPDGKLYIGFKNRCSDSCRHSTNGGDDSSAPPMEIIDTEDGFAHSSQAAPNDGLAVHTITIREGKLYYGSTAGLTIVELATDTASDVPLPFPRASGFAFFADGSKYYVASNNNECGLALLDSATNTVLDIDEYAPNGTDTSADSCLPPHAGLVLTPY